MDYIQIIPILDSFDYNPTPQQRAIYDFHEGLHSAQADDIYSLEWFQRTKLFLQEFSQPNGHPKTLDSWERVEELDLGEFFLAHPIAGYALWKILQACYNLDSVICGNSAEELATVKRWQDWKPFVYFRDRKRKIHSKWEKSLKLLKKQIECEHSFLEGDPIVQKLYDILLGVERLESASKTLADDFRVNLQGLKFVDEMLKRIATVIDDRRRMIADILNLDDSNPGSASDSEESFGYVTVDPYWSMDAAFMYIVLFLGLVFSLLFARLFAMTARHYE